MTQHNGLPVSGYRPQSDDAVAKVNRSKELEEHVLRLLDQLAADPETDKRWLQIGRTAIEQGFMAVNRSVFKPARIELGALASHPARDIFARGYACGLQHDHDIAPFDTQVDAAWTLEGGKS